MKQVCKTRKIQKTFVNLLSFCMGRCGIPLLALLRTLSKSSDIRAKIRRAFLGELPLNERGTPDMGNYSTRIARYLKKMRLDYPA